MTSLRKTDLHSGSRSSAWEAFKIKPSMTAFLLSLSACRGSSEPGKICSLHYNQGDLTVSHELEESRLTTVDTVEVKCRRSQARHAAHLKTNFQKQSSVSKKNISAADRWKRALFSFRT
jgi:hypothetical protein